MHLLIDNGSAKSTSVVVNGLSGRIHAFGNVAMFGLLNFGLLQTHRNVVERAPIIKFVKKFIVLHLMLQEYAVKKSLFFLTMS